MGSAGCGPQTCIWAGRPMQALCSGVRKQMPLQALCGAGRGGLRISAYPHAPCHRELSTHQFESPRVHLTVKATQAGTCLPGTSHQVQARAHSACTFLQAVLCWAHAPLALDARSLSIGGFTLLPPPRSSHFGTVRPHHWQGGESVGGASIKSERVDVSVLACSRRATP